MEQLTDTKQTKDTVERRKSVDGRSTKSGFTTMSVETLLETLEAQAEGESVTSLETANALNKLGRQFREDNNFPQAASYLNEALTMYLKFDGTETAVVQVRIQLGFIYTAQNNFRYAESSLEDALESAANESQEQADAQYCLGLLRKAQQNNAEATDAFEQALAIYQILGKSSDISNMQYHLGLVYLAQNQHGHAEHFLQEAVAALETNGEDDDKLAEAFRHLGLAQHANAKYEEALASFQSALDEFERLDEKQHLTGLTHYHMGTVYLAQPNYSAAIDSFNKALEAFGEDCGDIVVADVQYHLGLAEKAAHNLDQALVHWNLALTQYTSENTDQVYNSKIEQISTYIGQIYLAQGNYRFAIASFESIFELYEDLPAGTAIVSVANTHRQIGEVHLAANDVPNAKLSLEEALRMYRTLDQQTEVAAVQLLLNQTNPQPQIVAPQAITTGDRQHTIPLSTSNRSVVSNEPSDCCASIFSCLGLFGGNAAPKRKGSDVGNPLQEPLNGDADTANYGSTTPGYNGSRTDG